MLDELRLAHTLLASGLVDAKRRGLHAIAGAMFAGLLALEAQIAALTPPPPVEEPAPAPEQPSAD